MKDVAVTTEKDSKFRTSGTSPQSAGGIVHEGVEFASLHARSNPSQRSENLHSSTLKRLGSSHSSTASRYVLQLQRQYGNRYVQRVIAAARSENAEQQIAPDVESAIERKRGSGSALGDGVRAHMESAFGADFSGVRVHTDGEAGTLNRAVNAVAFTTGKDIFFSPGAYAPGSSAGWELLAHELTHVVQQGGSPLLQGKLVLGKPGDQYEQEAEAVSRQVDNARRAEAERATPQWSLSGMTTGHLSLAAGMQIQTKLLINRPGDRYEQEADEMADRVMRMPESRPSARTGIATAIPSVQRKCSCGGSCDKCRGDHEHKDEHEHLQMKRLGSGGFDRTIAPPNVQEVLGSPGQPLDQATRAFMEPSFGRDFSSVRVHSGSSDGESAQTIGAAAYTVGHHIVFGPGRFTPESHEGRRLIAHELTHVVQQNRGRAEGLQRKPETYQMTEVSPYDPRHNPLYFDPVGLYPHHPHQGGMRGELKDRQDEDEKFNLPSNRDPGLLVTEEWIHDWAIRQSWNTATGDHLPLRGIGSGDARPQGISWIFRLLRRHEDAVLNGSWLIQLGNRKIEVEQSLKFRGTETARQYWAGYLLREQGNLVERLNQNAISYLVKEVETVARSGRIPVDADLVKDTKRIKDIEDRPEQKQVTIPGGFGAAYDKMSVGLRVGHMHILSISDSYVYFEVIDHEHEGIYFWLSVENFKDLRPEQTVVVEGVAANTAGTINIGDFLKGFLEGVAAPVTMAYDLGANLTDLATSSFAAGIQFVSGRTIPFTCFGSICRAYDACLKSDKTPGDCKWEAVTEATEQATVIIPLYRQGRQCLKGDVEACGAIAALAFGYAEERLNRLTPEVKGLESLNASEIEDLAVSEAIHRPVEGAPKIAEALERPKEIEEPRQTPKIESASELENSRKLKEQNKKDIKEFARGERTHKGIPLAQQLEGELATLSHDATDPAKVSVPTAERFPKGEKASDYDAEMNTNVNGDPHRFERQKQTNGGRKHWCRFTTKMCDVPAPPKLDEAVDETLRAKARKSKEAAQERIESIRQSLADNDKNPQELGYTETTWEQFLHNKTLNPERALADLERRMDIHGVKAEKAPGIEDPEQRGPETGKTGAGMQAKPKHHIFPQDPGLRQFWIDHKFIGKWDIDEFTVELEVDHHQAIHGGGNYKIAKASGFDWNSKIMAELRKAEERLRPPRLLTREECLKIAKGLMKQYGIAEKFVPYR
jgi:hypothetical protein